MGSSNIPAEGKRNSGSSSFELNNVAPEQRAIKFIILTNKILSETFLFCLHVTISAAFTVTGAVPRRVFFTR